MAPFLGVCSAVLRVALWGGLGGWSGAWRAGVGLGGLEWDLEGWSGTWRAGVGLGGLEWDLEGWSGTWRAGVGLAVKNQITITFIPYLQLEIFSYLFILTLQLFVCDDIICV